MTRNGLAWNSACKARDLSSYLLLKRRDFAAASPHQMRDKSLSRDMVFGRCIT